MKDVCPLIRQWNIRVLGVGQNKQATLLKEISCIGFPNLGSLIIWNNHIESIECFPLMAMPSIDWINFGTTVKDVGINRITSTKILRKVILPTLREINFRNLKIM